MKKILCLFFAMIMALALTACGSAEAPQAPQNPTQTQNESSNPPAQTKAEDFTDVIAPFESLHDGAKISVKKRENIMELNLVCDDLNAETQPENWPDICSAA